LALALFWTIQAAAAPGDTVDDGLPPESPAAVKASARQAIQSGLAPQRVVEFTRAMLQYRFDENQIQRAHALLIEAQIDGTPEQPIIDKAFEGMAKNVQPVLIVGAMETVQARYSFAFDHAAKFSASQASRTQKLGEALADALAAGMSRAHTDEIVQALRQRARTMDPDPSYSLALESFQTARDVSRLGVSSQAVTDMVTQGLSKGFSRDDMRALHDSFLMEAQHTEPQNLARGYTAAMAEGKGFHGGSGTTGGQSGGSGGTPGGSGGGGGSGGSGGPGGGPGGGGPGGGPGGSGGPGGGK
jgi:hypothetical protein